MELQATAELCLPPAPPLHRRLATILGAVALRAAVLLLALAAWQVHERMPFTPASDVGYALGVVGGSLMLVLLLYPLRKRFPWLGVLGPMRYWFRFHLVAGIAGPFVVLLHSTFHIGSFNAAIALASMLLVVASGLVGRFLYRHIHHGLYGSRATLAEMQQALARQLEGLDALLCRLPRVKEEIARYSALVSHEPQGRWRRAGHFLALGAKRLLARRRVGRAIARYAASHAEAAHEDLRAVAGTIDAALGAVQRAAQFSTYERLFALWHVVHIPFLVLLVITAIVHVVAVHAY